jgi:hypothetical protein
MFPEASVSNTKVPLQFWMVEIRISPALTIRPPEKVEVPVPWEIIWPPVRIKPFAEASPPAESPAEIPPANVEVAVEDALIPPKNLVKSET